LTLTDKNSENFAIEIDEKALVLAKETIIIKAEPTKILEVLADIKNWSIWRSDIEYTKILDKKSQKELKFEWKSGGLKYRSVVHTHSNNLFGWTGRTVGAYAIHNWCLKKVENGTEVEASESLSGFSIRLMKKKMILELPQMMKKDLQELKNKCEEGSL